MSDCTANPEYQALLKSVIATPDDDLPRLVLSDWLREKGDQDRADFIQVQIELANRRNLLCSKCEMPQEVMYKWTKGCRGDVCRLRRREYESSKRHIVWDWNGGMGGGWGHLVDRHDYRRGWLEKVTCEMAVWIGGECGRCQATGAYVDGANWDETGRWLGGHETTDCLACSGTGRTPGIDRAVVAAHPVQTVVVTGTRPHHGTDGWFYWVREGHGWEGDDTLPAPVFDQLPDRHLDATGYLKGFATEQSATAALSAALIALARADAPCPV